jgi:NAD(P)H-hydrate epimerase
VELVESLIGTDSASPPAVVDAEALNSLASIGGWWDAAMRPCVLTPHPGEFARLLAGSGEDAAGVTSADDEARAGAADAAASKWDQVVLLKGARTVIASPDGRVARTPFANPALASGGTGDVLSGVVGALLAQGLEPYEAACAGAYLHGLAGEQVRARLGDAGLLASDLFAELPLARRRLVEMAA